MHVERKPKVPGRGCRSGGCYSILMRVDKKINLNIGRLGMIYFLPGYYTYTGRARKGLIARIQRHAKKRKTCRWHVDYLTSAGGVRIMEIIVHDIDSEKECEVNQFLCTLPSARIYAPGFGASDCKKRYGTHLVYFPERPRIESLQIPDCRWMINRWDLSVGKSSIRNI